MNTTTIFKEYQQKAITKALHEVRLAFIGAMQDIKSNIIQSVVDENDIPELREEFAKFVNTVAVELKQHDLNVQESTTAVNKGSINDILKVAIEAHQKGFLEESKDLFAYAAANCQDGHLDNLPLGALDSKCKKCESYLPITANFCPVCGDKLNSVILPQEILTAVNKLSKAGKTVVAANLIKKYCETTTQE